jgi:hydroxypyruvate isomerase
MFNEHELADRFTAAADAGFRAVEHPSPYAIPARELKARLADLGLIFVQMALPAGNTERGEKGVACLPGRQQDFDAYLVKGLDYAEELGCGMVHLMSGVVPSGAVRDNLWPIYVERLQQAAEAAARRNMTILIEPIGIATIADYFMDDPQAALRAAGDTPNIRLLFDAFHATNAGTDAADFVAGHMDMISHIHIADHPGRHEPGTGSFDFPKFFAALDDAGYRGRIGLEYLPAGDTSEGLAWLDAYASAVS